MLSDKQEIFNSIELITIFFILLVAIIIITAVLFHNRKRLHNITVENYENALVRSHYEAREQTMQTIGADLHDNIGQLLSLTALTLGAIEIKGDEKANNLIESSIDLTGRAILELKHLGKLIQGQQLIAIGLKEAIQHEVIWLEKSGKFDVSFDCDNILAPNRNMDKDLILFRIFQEVTNNIIKHSHANKINILLTCSVGILTLRLRDNGIGFNTQDSLLQQNGMGISSIKKRVALLGGELDIISENNCGTSTEIRVIYP